MASLRRNLERPALADKLREEAMRLVDQVSNVDPPGEQRFSQLMSALLMVLHEYQRAIPFCEMAVRRALQKEDPIEVAGMLTRQGHCYAFCGLKDEAAIPLRAAVKILRNYPQEPILPQVLIALGNALGKSVPNEAEELHKEAADIYVAKAQLESATVPWVNLGVLCSRQGRNVEALDFYQKALEVREKSLGISPERVATLLNNIADCHRRTRDFEEALRLIDRAIEILNSANSPKIGKRVLFPSGAYLRVG